MAAAKHILVIRLSAMGDVAMTVPVLKALRVQYPDVKITVVSHQFFKPLFNTIPNLNFFGVDLANRHKGFWGIFKLFADLRKLKVNAIADLHNVLRSKIIRTLFKLTGKQVVYTDKGRDDKKELTKLEVKEIKPVKNMFHRHADTFAALGYPINLELSKFPDKLKLSDNVVALARGTKNNCWLGIAPYAQYDSKIYPDDLMAQVIAQLAENTSLTIFLFGSKAEKEKLENLQQGKSNVVLVPGAVSFEEEITLISNLDVLLAMDSGNAHIAAMLGVKVVTLWGATHPYAGFMPFMQPMEYAIVSNRNEYPFLPTSVYGNKVVPGYENAMRTIKPETVIAKIVKILEPEKRPTSSYTSS